VSKRSGRVPQLLKTAHTTPLLKKASLYSCDVKKNYRPISKLSVISILLERVILHRLLEHKTDNLLLSVQSAYPKCHSTETAMARVLSDILTALTGATAPHSLCYIHDRPFILGA